jgi:radical SAM-linked protein
LGCTSQEDLLDMWLAEQLDPLELRNRIAESAPAGLAIEEVQALRDDEPTLQRIIDGAEYEIQVDPSDLKGVTDRIAQVLAAHRIPRVRRGKAYDLRPLIEHLALEIEGRLLMRLSARQGATGRPDEVLKALELTPEDYVPHRTRLLLSK